MPDEWDTKDEKEEDDFPGTEEEDEDLDLEDDEEDEDDDPGVPDIGENGDDD